MNPTTEDQKQAIEDYMKLLIEQYINNNNNQFSISLNKVHAENEAGEILASQIVPGIIGDELYIQLKTIISQFPIQFNAIAVMGVDIYLIDLVNIVNTEHFKKYTAKLASCRFTRLGSKPY